MLHLASTTPHAARQDAWSGSNPTCTARYSITADAAADLLCRLLNLFAMQYLVPLDVQATRKEDRFVVALTVDGLSWHRAQVIGEKMRNLIDVRSVDLEPDASNHVISAPMSLATGQPPLTPLANLGT